MPCIDCLQVRAGTKDPYYGPTHCDTESGSDSSGSDSSASDPSSSESDSGSCSSESSSTDDSGEQLQGTGAAGFVEQEANAASNNIDPLINAMEDLSVFGEKLVDCVVRELFGTRDGDKWFTGKVTSYSSRTRKYTLVNHCHSLLLLLPPSFPPPLPLPPPSL